MEKINIKAVQVERLMDQEEVAEVLKVSTKTLEYWRWKGIGPKYIKVGRLARYLESDVQDFINHLSKGGTVEQQSEVK